MDRCHLKGEYGDRLHAVLCAAGYNIKWLLRMIAKEGVPFVWAIFLRLAKGTWRLAGGLLRHTNSVMVEYRIGKSGHFCMRF